MKRALITGVTGQDGAYLAKFLMSKGYEVYGTYRRLSTPNFWRLNYLGIMRKVNLISMDLNDTTSIMESIEISQPDEIYHLAAQSFVGASFEQPIATGEVTGLATTRMLEAILKRDKDIRFYNASTSELYGNSSSGPLDEATPFKPQSPYATAKLYSYWMTRLYRDAYGLFAANGILFNHESPIRGLEFVTRKITNAIAKIKLGIEKKVILGNIESFRDWGYAPDYVEGMWKILQNETPEDFVLATGETHSVKEFLSLSCEIADLAMDDVLEVSSSLKRPLEVHYLVGNPSKAEVELNWTHRMEFRDLVKEMTREDIIRWDSFINGKPVIWDAQHYDDNNNIIKTRYKMDA